MSALPAPTPIREIMPAPGPLDSNQWAGLEEAAVALHRDPAHLRRLCREQLERRGYAKKARGQWFISRRFNLALAGGRVGEKFQTPDLKHFPAHQVKLAWKRAACVDVYRDARSNWTGTFEQLKKVLIPDLRKQYPELKVSARSLDRWYKVYDTPADIVKLIDARGGNQVGGADPAWWDHLKSIYLDQRKPSLKVCWERARDQARIDGWRACSYESCRRQLDARIPPQTRAQFRDPKSYRWNYAPYLEQNPEAWDAGCLWIGDHCQLDFHCRFGNRILRPWITVWIDWRTRRIAGFTLSDKPNSSTILAALRYGLIHDRDANMGGPDAVWIDNGKDFDSYTLQGQTKQERQAVRRIVDGFRLDHEQTYGVFSLLNIQVHFARPYNPNGKGREERWFGTLHDQFDRSFRTYCGASPDRKPEDLQNILKQPHLIPDFEHVRDRLENYIAGYNASAEHSRQDMTGWSPDAMLLAKCPRKRVMADPEALDLCLQHWHQPVRVGRNGVTIRPAGKAISYGQFNEALGRYKKTQLPLKVSYDPADITTIRIFDEKMVFICTARVNQRGGGVAISQDALKEQIRKQSRYKKAKRDMARNSHFEYLSTFEQIALDTPASAPPTPEQPAALQFIQSPLDEASKGVQREQLRQAAGAEHDESPRGLPSPSERLKGFGLDTPFAFERVAREAEDSDYSRLSAILGDSADEPLPVIDILGGCEEVSP